MNDKNRYEIDQEVYAPKRISEIIRLRLHEAEADKILDEYASKVAKELAIEIGLVSIILDEAQKFAGSYGLTGWMSEAKGTPVEWSYCVNSVKSKEPFIVENAREHPKTKSNPLTDGEGIRCYAGVPLITKNNQVLGNLCVLGTSSTRDFTDVDMNILRTYAAKVMEHLEARVS